MLPTKLPTSFILKSYMPIFSFRPPLHPLWAIRRCHSRTDLDTTSHTSIQTLYGAKVLHVFQSHCLITGSQEKTTYRSALFPSGGGGAKDALQKKATRKATSEVVRSWLAGRSQAWLSERQYQLLKSILNGKRGKRSERNSRWSSEFTQIDPDGWLDVSMWFISWMKLRLGPLKL